MATDGEFLSGMLKFVARSATQWNNLGIDGLGPVSYVLGIVQACFQEDRLAHRNLTSTAASLDADWAVVINYLDKMRKKSSDKDEYYETLGYFVLANACEKWFQEGQGSEFKFYRGIETLRIDLPDSCDVCGKLESDILKLKKCARCGWARYCSVECQRQDWTSGLHKERCRSG